MIMSAMLQTRCKMLEGRVNDHAEQRKAEMPKRHINLPMTEFDFGIIKSNLEPSL